MKPRQASSPVSLFPFLAVLVCAMGALIFLLLVATRRIRADAIQRSQQQPDSSQVADLPEETPAAEVPARPVMDWEAILDELAGRRDDQQGRLRQLQQTLRGRQVSRDTLGQAALDQQNRLHQLAEQRKALGGKIEPLQREIAELREDLERLELETEYRRQQRRQAESRFTFLPFDGATGTHRRPVFIECHAEKIVFASEEIDLTVTDIEGFTLDVNPLLAGTRALIDYWHAHDRQQAGDGEVSRPYVLMIVRPDGVRAFYIARQLLRRLREPMGYELVPEDLPLSWTPRNAQAVSACRNAVNEVLARRQQQAGRGTGRVDGLAKGSGGRRRPGTVLERPGRGAATAGPLAGSGAGPSRGLSPGRQSPVGTGDVASRQQGDATTRANPGAGSGELPGGTPGAKKPRQDGNVASRRVVASDTPKGSSAGKAADATRQADAAADGPPPSVGVRGIPTFGSLSLNGSRAERSDNSRSGGSHGQRGRNSSRWGIVGLRATIGYERRVRVHVEQDHVVVAAEPPIAAGVDVPAAELREQVLAALQRTARTWGPPPDRFYWVPSVMFQVSPGGHLHYERLNDHLRGWSLPTSVEFVLKREPAKTGLEGYLR